PAARHGPLRRSHVRRPQRGSPSASDQRVDPAEIDEPHARFEPAPPVDAYPDGVARAPVVQPPLHQPRVLALLIEPGVLRQTHQLAPAIDFPDVTRLAPRGAPRVVRIVALPVGRA